MSCHRFDQRLRETSSRGWTRRSHDLKKVPFPMKRSYDTDETSYPGKVHPKESVYHSTVLMLISLRISPIVKESTSLSPTTRNDEREETCGPSDVRRPSVRTLPLYRNWRACSATATDEKEETETETEAGSVSGRNLDARATKPAPARTRTRPPNRAFDGTWSFVLPLPSLPPSLLSPRSADLRARGPLEK